MYSIRLKNAWRNLQPICLFIVVMILPFLSHGQDESLKMKIQKVIHGKNARVGISLEAY
jgi:hypothetical protein